MTRKGYQKSSSFQTRRFTLASVLLWLFGVCARRLSAQSDGTPVIFSSSDIDEIVSAHNDLRGRVNPPASNMQALVWDEDLAAAALEYSRQCLLEPNPLRASQVTSFDTVGENLSAAGTTNPDYATVIEVAWFNQRRIYNFAENSCTSPGACSFYTQLVWANTVAVGCGASTCEMIEPGFPVPDSVIFICYYGPEGNIAGERPYIAGLPCTGCLVDQVCMDNTCTAVTTTVATTEPASTTQLQTTPPSDITTVTPSVRTMTPSTVIPSTVIPTMMPSTPASSPPPPLPPRPPKPPCPPGSKPAFVFIHHPHPMGYRKFFFRCPPSSPKPPRPSGTEPTSVKPHPIPRLWKIILQLKKALQKKLSKVTLPTSAPPTPKPSPQPPKPPPKPSPRPPKPSPRPPKPEGTRTRSRSKSSRRHSRRRSRSSRRTRHTRRH